ncbi:hypothetical protein SLA2020_515440 [Shorea laevis]
MASTNQSLFFCLVLLFVLGCFASLAWARSLSELSITERFEQWMAQYGRVYNDAGRRRNASRFFKKM